MRVHRDAAVVARIRAELVANDWRVRELGPDANSARAPLAALASVANGRAALRMQPERAAIELWVVSSEGETSGSGETVALPDDERDDALLALRTTEALRARGLRLPKRAEAAVAPPPVSTPTPVPSAGGVPSTTSELSEAEHVRAEQERLEKERLEKERAEKERLEQERLEKQREEQERAAREAEEEAEAEAEDAEEEEPEAPEAPMPPDTSLLYLELGPALAASPGGATIMWAGWANLRVQPDALFSFSAFGFVPLVGGVVHRSEEGEPSMRSVIVGATADLHGGYRALDLSAGAGAALLLTDMRPENVGEDFMPNREDPPPLFASPAAVARLGLQLRLGGGFRIGARALFGMSLRKILMNSAGEQDQSSWGQPFVLGTIGIEYGLPEPTR